MPVGTDRHHQDDGRVVCLALDEHTIGLARTIEVSLLALRRGTVNRR
jgi:hypothetical protein